MNTPAEVAANYIKIGIGKVKLPLGRMFVLALIAGAFIALAGVGASTAASTIEGLSAARMVSACVFPAGLAMVLLAGSELFTGNALLVIPLLERQVTVVDILRNWVVVYIGNLVGSLAVAAVAAYSHLPGSFGGALAQAAMNTASVKCSLSFSDAFLRGIACNFLVCIAVWMAFAAKDVVGKVAGLYLPIMLFVVCGFEHSVANMLYIPFGLFIKGMPEYAGIAESMHLASLTWGGFAGNLIPVTLGNIVGGLIVGIVYWYCYLKGKKEA